MIDRMGRDERGVTLSEVMVATMITTVVSLAFYAFFFAFADDVHREERRATTLESVRPAVSELVLELRQAVDLDGDTAVVTSLDSAWDQLDLTFHSDRMADADGPERYRYYLGSCAAGTCDLIREVTLADMGSGPDYTYTSAPMVSRLVEDVLTDGPEPLFSGVSWRGGYETITTQCGTGVDCVFEVLRVRLRVDPDTTGNPLPIIELQEDVRFRNATT